MRLRDRNDLWDAENGMNSQERCRKCAVSDFYQNTEERNDDEL